MLDFLHHFLHIKKTTTDSSNPKTTNSVLETLKNPATSKRPQAQTEPTLSILQSSGFPSGHLMPYRLVAGPLLRLSAAEGGGAAGSVSSREERRRFLVLYEIVASEGSDRPPPANRGAWVFEARPRTKNYEVVDATRPPPFVYGSHSDVFLSCLIFSSLHIFKSVVVFR